MELHHSKHHNTYVTSYNKLLEQAKEAEQKSDSQAMPKLSAGLNFHGGGARLPYCASDEGGRCAPHWMSERCMLAALAVEITIACTHCAQLPNT